MTRVIALHGPVACGKSTLLNELKTQLPNCYIVHEYFDALDDAPNKLNQYLNGSMPAFQFQSYILDYFESMANKLKDSTFDYVLVERTPIEGIQFFAKLDLINDEMTEDQYNQLLQRAQSMTFYPKPSTDNQATFFTDYMTPSQLAQLIISVTYDFDIVEVVKLRASLPTIKQRIKQRGRPCEVEHYTDDYLMTMIETYD